MKAQFQDIQNAYNILKEYKGKNPYIIELKNGVYAYKNKTLGDWEIFYILKNHMVEPKPINKIVKVTKYYGSKKQEEWNTDFLIEKLFITYYFGETNTHYHCMVQYRQSVPPQQLFIPKKEILTLLFDKDFLQKEIDFTKYNIKDFKLTSTQENSIKFLTTRNKGILSLEMGMGKTVVSIVSAIENNYNKILVICPASLKTNWKNEILRYENEENITIVEGSTWKENKWTIINYDILKNFHTVATETKAVKKKEYTDEGIKWITVEKTKKTNKKEIVDKCLESSQLYQMEFDLIIIDEAHKLSNKTSGMYQIIEDLIKRTKIDSIYALTGTIVKNDPINLYNVLKIVGCDFCQTYLDYSNYLKTYCGAKQIFQNKNERNYYSNKFIKEHGKNEWHDLDYFEKKELDEYLSKTCKKIWIMGEPTNLDELSEKIKPYYYCEINKDIRTQVKIQKELIEYTLSNDEQKQYDTSWDEYINTHDENDIEKLIQNHKLIEGSVFRQLLANFMVNRSIKLAEKELKLDKKIIIFCCFDKELYDLKDYFGDTCVVYNGKMTGKQKDNALKTFKHDDTVKIFIGNLQSASVGLNLNEANVIIFNNISFVPSDNIQAEFRVLRLGQTKDVTIYYQKFVNTYMDKMFEILQIKNEISNKLIKTEEEK